MVDVSAKADTAREATASGAVRMRLKHLRTSARDLSPRETCWRWLRSLE